MKIVKYISLFLVSVIFLLIAGTVFFPDSGRDAAEDMKREKIALQIKSEIEHYYDQNKNYPTSLNVLPVASSETFISYYKEDIFRYERSLADAKPVYRFIWVFSGLFTKEGSLHSYAWSGKQCSNEKTFLDLMAEDDIPDAHGCFFIDLH